MKYWKIKFGILVLLCLTVMLLTSCQQEQKEIVDLTLWHVYGAQTDSPLNSLIDQFNQTVGHQEGIRIQVTSVSNTNTIHKAVLASAYEDPGASPLPDLFISYPKTVMALPDQNILVDYRDYFTPQELEQYIPSFLEEGMVDGRLTVFPAAKSTEIMFVNKTIFDRYAKETGAKLSDLRTWEGLFSMAKEYNQWSDNKTPDIPNDGKAFFVHDYHFNYFQTGVESLGEEFFSGDGLAYGKAFDQVWEPYAEAALSGGLWLQGGYATEPLRTGDAVVSAGSSASVLYYTDTVTYPDNTSEKVEMIALPCPVFENGENLVIQRGAGFCLKKSTKAREQAAVTFLKWLTEPERNVEFVTSLGYMPVTEEAFTRYLPKAVEKLTEPMYQELYRAFLETQESYIFYTPPLLESYLELEGAFEYNVRRQLSEGRREYLEGLEAQQDKETYLQKEIVRNREAFKKTLP